ncbi:hypothetical protein [Sulfurihydrogenibium subterraneum]|uniref:hypothetical protein n=1 Tax=Sulfurihydrogenibium subterraneum TaxID=171121 RepID=UPI00048D44D9|nr:hypothetical protein [Sulfurihydrogenibium subterraneum]
MFEKEIEELITEHREINAVLKKYEENLGNLSEEDIKNFIQFIETTVENHAKKEDEDFLTKVLEVNPDYDAEAFSFAHNTIREGLTDLKDTFEEYIKGKKTLKDVYPFVKRVITLIYDHFLEEENFFFPDIKRIKLIDGKFKVEEIDLKEEKEWL